jgi:hypothetical protein
MLPSRIAENTAVQEPPVAATSSAASTNAPAMQIAYSPITSSEMPRRER